MSGLPIEILDGSNTIGGTKILVTNNNHGLLLDFGLNFKQYGIYFEEYLKPRTCFGIKDFWDLDLLPHYKDLYRPDLCQCELDAPRDLPVDTIDGVILTHAHEDHCGLISMLKSNIPIISSSTSFSIMRAVQDSGKSDVQKQICYIAQYNLEQCRNHQVLKSPDWHKNPHSGRDAFVMTNDLSDELSNLWKRKARPDGGGRNINPGEILNLDESTIDWDITSFPIDHSIMGACAVKIETESGNIFYTGDIRKSGAQRANTDSFVSKASSDSPWVLIVEGTQVTREGECKTTEEQCKENCKTLIDDYRDKFIIADFSARNIERLYSFHDIADELSRKLVITAKDAYMLHCLQTIDSSKPLPSDTLLIFDAPKSDEEGWEKWIYETFKPYLVSASTISENLSDYILAFSFFDIKYLNDIKPDEGLYLYSSSEPFTEEQQIDIGRLSNWIERYNLELRGIKFENKEWQIEPGYHCSGHATKTELEEIIREISPENLIPVHTIDRNWFKKFEDISNIVI
jgi:ribonuclease J